MIAGAHFLLYSKDPEADRTFFKTVLEFSSIDISEGWLKSKGVTCANPVEAEWGISTSVRLSSGGEIGLYQPMHPTMIQAQST